MDERRYLINWFSSEYAPILIERPTCTSSEADHLQTKYTKYQSRITY